MLVLYVEEFLGHPALHVPSIREAPRTTATTRATTKREDYDVALPKPGMKATTTTTTAPATGSDRADEDATTVITASSKSEARS